jgi:hypothetical protein
MNGHHASTSAHPALTHYATPRSTHGRHCGWVQGCWDGTRAAEQEGQGGEAQQPDGDRSAAAARPRHHLPALHAQPQPHRGPGGRQHRRRVQRGLPGHRQGQRLHLPGAALQPLPRTLGARVRAAADPGPPQGAPVSPPQPTAVRAKGAAAIACTDGVALLLTLMFLQW